MSEPTEPADLTLARINFNVDVDAKDIVDALNNNDDLITAFVIELIREAGSSELLADLHTRLGAWVKEEETAGGE